MRKILVFGGEGWISFFKNVDCQVVVTDKRGAADLIKEIDQVAPDFILLDLLLLGSYEAIEKAILIHGLSEIPTMICMLSEGLAVQYVMAKKDAASPNDDHLGSIMDPEELKNRIEKLLSE